MRLLHFGIRPVCERRDHLASATYSARYIPAPRDRRSDGLWEPRRRCALNSNGNRTKTTGKGTSTNAGRRAQPPSPPPSPPPPSTRGADEIPNGVILHDVRVGFRAFRWEFPTDNLTWVLLKRSHDGVGFRKFYKTQTWCGERRDVYIEVGPTLVPGRLLYPVMTSYRLLANRAQRPTTNFYYWYRIMTPYTTQNLHSLFIYIRD